MSQLANLSDTIKNALEVLGRPNSISWLVFNQVNGKTVGPEIAEKINKKQSNVALKLAHLNDMGLLEVKGKRGKAVIYKKIPELRTLKPKTKIRYKLLTENEKSKNGSTSENNLKQLGLGSKVIQQVVDQGKKFGIENIDKNWIDALVILNFIETATTKYLMDHGYTEAQVKNMKWDQKLTKLRDELSIEAETKNYTIRTSSLSFFRNYRDVRNEQDHIAHLPSAKITKSDVGLLQKNLKLFINVVFVEPNRHP